jgi:hypothetical protein
MVLGVPTTRVLSSVEKARWVMGASAAKKGSCKRTANQCSIPLPEGFRNDRRSLVQSWAGALREFTVAQECALRPFYQPDIPFQLVAGSAGGIKAFGNPRLSDADD